MPRIFSSLAIVSMVLVIAALMWGMIGGDYNGISAKLRSLQHQRAAPPSVQPRWEETTDQADVQHAALMVELRQVQRHVRIHILLGILATLVAVLVQSIGITYFIGTGRWCKEVVEAYALDEAFLKEGTQLKRASFPFAMLGIATVLTVGAFGAAADPGTLRETTAAWVAPHYWAAAIGTAALGVALWMQAIAIRRNQDLIERVVSAVRDVRAARGLEVQ